MGLGGCPCTGETLIGTSEGVVRVFAAHRVQYDDKWDRTTMVDLRSTRKRPFLGKDDAEIPIGIRHPAGSDARQDHKVVVSQEDTNHSAECRPRVGSKLETSKMRRLR